MQFPLRMRFKILAIAPQIYVTDSTGAEVFYVRQKMFRLKEDIAVYRTSAQRDEVVRIRADRVLDFSACYHFSDPSGQVFGAVRRKGLRSIWRAEYEVLDAGDQHDLTIREDNAMVKVLDSLLGSIPFVGWVMSMMINPSYTVSSTDGRDLVRITKQPAFFEGNFDLTQLGQADDATMQRGVMAVMMMLLLERSRG
ncbi:MAG: hypothetical protein KTR31_41140 [Myxococcales bacterium]|nr:hypothetical protein [Myxococcales bacterium]